MNQLCVGAIIRRPVSQHLNGAVKFCRARVTIMRTLHSWMSHSGVKKMNKHRRDCCGIPREARQPIVSLRKVPRDCSNQNRFKIRIFSKSEPFFVLAFCTCDYQYFHCIIRRIPPYPLTQIFSKIMYFKKTRTKIYFINVPNTSAPERADYYSSFVNENPELLFHTDLPPANTMFFLIIRKKRKRN